jgi:hypothetical protein
MFKIAHLKYSTPPAKMLCITLDEGLSWRYINIKKFNGNLRLAKNYARQYIEENEFQQ